MTSLVNMFYNLDNSRENRNNTNAEYKNNLISTPALNQGANFKNYQNKIKNKIKKILIMLIVKKDFKILTSKIIEQT
jgi:hypothetical protein